MAVDRFDSLVRSERYFTATLLPALLLHNNFDGLRRFLGLVDKKIRSEWLPNEPEPQTRTKLLPRVRPDKVEVITEFHIARDLRAAGALSPKTSAAPPVTNEGNETEAERRNAPDLVIIVGNRVIVCEGKFFSSSRPSDLNGQLKSQRAQIRHLFAARPGDFEAFLHIAVLPVIYEGEIDCNGVLTWGEIADLAEDTLGRRHYVSERLRAALKLYRQQVGLPGKKNYEGVLTIAQAIARCRAQVDAIELGHVGGEADLLRRPWEYIAGKPWKWRVPGVTAGKVNQKNWIRGSRFLAIVDAMER